MIVAHIVTFPSFLPFFHQTFAVSTAAQSKDYVSQPPCTCDHVQVMPDGVREEGMDAAPRRCP